MERLSFSNTTAYDAVEAAIHLNRYAYTKPFCQGARVLDAACGQGYGSYLMKTWGAKEVVGIDIDEDSVNQASRLFKQESLIYKQHTVENLPFEDHSFDLVISFETIEHIDHPEMFLKEIKRVLKPDGTIIISCPNDNYYYENDSSKNPFHKREYTFFEFKEMTERNLGYRGEYHLAFALDGFVNIPFEKRTEPEQGTCEDALGMLHYETCDSALCVPQERYLNHWNANYYIGIWNGRGAQYRFSTVIAPRETFVDHKDKDYDLLRHFDWIQKEIAESKEMRSVISALRDELAVSRETNTRLDELIAERDSLVERCREIDVLTAERDSLVERCREIDVLTTERDDAHQQINNQTMEIERLRLLVDMTRRERDEARLHMRENWDRYQASLSECAETRNGYQMVVYERNELKNRVDSLESSRGVKLLGKLYNLRERLKRLFR